MVEVEVRGLTKTFGRVTAVRGMSFTAPAGKVTGFLGPNGSGKTTTLRVVLGLAGALLGDPQVLLHDEPANGLDPAGIAWLRGLLRGLADDGRTVIVASHVLSEIAQTADHVVIVSDGQVRFAGALGDIGASGTALESAFLKLTAAAG